jgi:hypothetical protein
MKTCKRMPCNAAQLNLNRNLLLINNRMPPVIFQAFAIDNRC